MKNPFKPDHSDQDRELAANSRRLIGIEDVTTELTSTDGALHLPELDDHTLAVLAGMRRGTSDRERDIHRPIHWLFEASLPDFIDKDHPFYRRYGHLAVKQAAS